MKAKKKIMASALALSMAVGAGAAAFADSTIGTAGGAGESQVRLTADAAVFSVTVPTFIPVNISGAGVVTVPDTEALTITNNSVAPIKVTGIDFAVTDESDWNLAAYDTLSIHSERVDSNKLGMMISANGDAVKTTSEEAAQINTITNDDAWKIRAVENDNTLSLTVDAKATAVSRSVSGADIAKVVFTIGWAR